ncbi:MAG: amidohydrolase family protein, partial [Firmicutes bacterium]|nr:amidohydrolase family protein [Bacillota bacterium]
MDLIGNTIYFHTHCFPDALASRAVGVLAERCSIRPTHDGTVSGLLRSMDAAGIRKSVVANIATNPKQTVKVNDFAIAANSERIISFGSVHPLYEDWRAEIDRLRAAGVKGVKFHCDYQETEIDDPAMLRIYEYAFAAGLLVLFHTGRDAGLPDLGRGTPRRIRNVVDVFNTPRIIAAHMGGETYAD